jgi:hypothetical protein
VTISEHDQRLVALAAAIDAQRGRFELLRGASSFDAYLAAPSAHADEETLTEPLLGAILERVLRFPVDAYVPQLGKGGLKPDFTPRDLIAHSFVFDAKASDQDLGTHEPQIRRYMTQRSLDFGVLFNLRELRVYRRGAKGHDPRLSFAILPLWQATRGEALVAPELDAFDRFCRLFAYRDMTLGEKIEHVRRQSPWAVRLAAGEPVQVDIEFLVDQLRVLSRRLTEDAAAQFDRFDGWLALNPHRRPRLRDELRLLALDLEPGVELGSLPEDPAAWRSGGALSMRVWRQYLLRVAYRSLTRILLYRSWEDVEFVGSYLYDGGFDRAYTNLSQKVTDVLAEAILHGAERYRWLFGADNNYDWYAPREDALVETLYLLAPVPLGKLDADVLGGLYVSYVDEIDRDRLGQFFTPRPVVRFMLDRAGFRGADVFRIEGDARLPRRVLDFATGSGGFLVEAARRVVDEGGVAPDDVRGLREALTAIATGFFGGEISPFPYYLTEVNLLLQVSRLLGQLRVATGDAPSSFVLGVVHADTLMTKSNLAESFEGFDPALRGDRAELTSQGFDLAPLDGPKLEAFRQLRRDETFDLVVGNPPYVAEPNNRPLFERLRAIDAWKGIYRGKTDYSYYFLYLAAEKLAPGGRLCTITPAGWMNAGEAGFLREKLAALRLDELYLFGAYRLFAADQGPAPTPTVESAILVATKAEVPEDHRVRVVVLEDDALWLDRDELLEEMERRAAGEPGRADGILVHDVPQAELRPEHPWPVKFAAADVATRVVARLQALLDDEAAPVDPLEREWKVFRGIETGADAYSGRIQRRLSAAQRAEVQHAGGLPGAPILELPAGAEQDRPWADHPEVLARSIEPRGILYGALDELDYTSLVVCGPDPPAAVLAALEPWRTVLSTRAEIARNPRRRWWEAAWPRNGDDLASPKVIALYRTDRGRFALDESGDWRPSTKTTLVVGREPGAPVAYLCGLLNSELLDLWYAVRGKTPRDVWRNYEPKRMNELPYRRPEGDPRAEEVAELVRALADNRRALLPHRPFVRGLTAVVKDPWRTGPPEADDAALVAALPKSGTTSVRVDSALAVIGSPQGRLVRDSPGAVAFRRGGGETGRVEGDPADLDLLVSLVGRETDGAEAILLPKDRLAYATARAARLAEAERLLAEGRALVERVERLVCALYDVPDELAEAVVEHAAARASSID